MEVNKYLRKIKLLLENVLEGKIVLNENNVEKLLKFLEDRNEQSPGRLILESPCFSDIIFQSLEKTNNASTSVNVFLIKIVTMLFGNELQFTKMQLQGYQAFSSQFGILGNLNNVPSPNLHLACIQLATVQISHRSGLKMIIERKAWQNILYTNIHHRPQKVSNAAYKFMAKLVWKLNEYDSEPELLEVLSYIVEPILSSGYLNVPVLDSDTDIKLTDEIFSHLSALLAILSETDKYAPVNKVISLIKDHFIVDQRIYEIHRGTKNPNLLTLLNPCLFRYSFVILRHLLFSKQVDDFCNKMTAFHRNYVVHALEKRDAFTLVDYVIQSNIIWSNFEKSHATEFNFPLIFERNGQKIEFTLQITIHLLMPMVSYSTVYRNTNKIKMTDAIELHIVKMGKAITDYIYSCCYMFLALLGERGATYRKRVTIHTLKELQRLKGHISESQVGPMFQTLYFLLEIFILCDETGRPVMTENSIDQDDLRMLSHLLEAMKMLLKEHNIPWYENLEIVSIQAVLLNLIKQSFLTTKQVVQVLDLINICVTKFLSPNMSLLVESKCKQDSTLDDIGKNINTYMQHEDWEVRDSALNLLNTCTEISFIKYIPLQTVIRENNLMTLTVSAALTDPEFYAQCTALKCLTAATKIDSLWQEVLVRNPHIYLQLIYILRNHSEGMVRKEAVNVLTGVYTNKKITSNFQNTLYEVMLTAAIDDLHWEVQIAALKFWKSAIQNHLTDRGMLDGKFPSVTFSREKRKIIILNDREIQRQLTGIMDHLSNIGCLTALLECTNEIHHTEVIDQAYLIAKELVEILDKYKFEKEMHGIKTEPVENSSEHMDEDSNVPMDLSCATSEEEKDKVIDDILGVNICEHMINLHDDHCQSIRQEMDIDSAYCPRRELVKTDKFLDTLRNENYSSIIENKKQSNYECLDTLESLLNEILDL